MRRARAPAEEVDALIGVLLLRGNVVQVVLQVLHARVHLRHLPAGLLNVVAHGAQLPLQGRLRRQRVVLPSTAERPGSVTAVVLQRYIWQSPATAHLFGCESDDLLLHKAPHVGQALREPVHACVEASLSMLPVSTHPGGDSNPLPKAAPAVTDERLLLRDDRVTYMRSVRRQPLKMRRYMYPAPAATPV